MAAVAFALAAPGRASADLAVSQTATPKPVRKGELLTITVSVTNPGPGTAGADQSQVEIFPLRGASHQAAANPYSR